jgi:hypothetical protein
MRTSDRLERQFVCVKVLVQSGLSNKEACIRVAELESELLEELKRERPDGKEFWQGYLRTPDTIRTSVAEFDRRNGDPKVVEWYVGQFLFNCEAGILVNGEYAEDSGQRLTEYYWKQWQRVHGNTQDTTFALPGEELLDFLSACALL